MQFIVGNFPEKKRVVSSLPFDSKNKYSMVSVEHHGQVRHFVKGAPENFYHSVQNITMKMGKRDELFLFNPIFNV